MIHQLTIDSLFTQHVDPQLQRPRPTGEDIGEGPAVVIATRMQAIAALNRLIQFIGHSQRSAIASAMRGDERQFFYDKVVEIDALIAAMPKTYDQDGLGDKAVVHLHYFTGGADWWITEKDKETIEEPGQHQAFGLADLGWGGELGYISIVELLSVGAELDFYFKPRTLEEIKSKRN